MAIFNILIGRYRLLSTLLAFSFLVTACGQAAQPTATVTPAPTPAQPTATMTLAPTATPTPTPVIESDWDLELPEGNAERGQSRAIQFRCAVCHIQGARGPSFNAAEGMPNIMERGDLRIADPAYEGSASTNREYLIESVFLPEVYLIPGNWPEAMPTDYGDLMTEQDVADILVWMGTFD